MTRPFRFGVQAARSGSRQRWQDKARKIEDLGYSSFLMPDHFTGQLAPIPALVSAADATTNLRVGTIVLGNDYRHPVVLAQEAATVDLLTDGRLELGIGAGWMRTDYDAAGLPYDRPRVRIERLSESLTILKGLLGEGPVSFSGTYYTVNHEGQPKPQQKPHPPFIIGGGGRRILSLAAREADVISLNFSLEAGAVTPEALKTGTGSATEEKLRWVREAAGPRFDQIELNAIAFTASVSHDPRQVPERMAAGFGVPVEDLLDSPHILTGPIDYMVEALQRRRERFGISYIVFGEDRFEELAPVVQRLAGT